jgi:uncharacterized protein DUF1843
MFKPLCRNWKNHSASKVAGNCDSNSFLFTVNLEGENMPVRKVATKIKRAKKAYGGYTPIRPLYAAPIYEAIKRGDAAEMKKLAAQARKHISEVTAALTALEKKTVLKRK